MRVLVVEDDRKVGGFIRTGLEQEGYAVDLLHGRPRRERPGAARSTTTRWCSI